MLLAFVSKSMLLKLLSCLLIACSQATRNKPDDPSVSIPPKGLPMSNDTAPHPPQLNNKVVVSLTQKPQINGQSTDFSNPDFKLSKHPSCVNDINTICAGQAKYNLNNNLATLECLNDADVAEVNTINTECQHLVWEYKSFVTTDKRFSEALATICASEIDKRPDCKSIRDKPEETGHLMDCLMDYYHDVGDKKCLHYLDRFSRIVFSDYRLVYKFKEQCNADIQKLQCGRVQQSGAPTTSEPILSQGVVIACLMAHVRELQETCRHEILRLAELQADDYQRDRQLFFACRDMREVFCHVVPAGKGKVYDCLMENRFHNDMSDTCREKLGVREKLIAEDYKVSRMFGDACQRDIEQYKCIEKTDPRSSTVVNLFKILDCLLSTHDQNEEALQQPCVVAMQKMQKMLLSDYQLSPQIVTRCEDEIKLLCNGAKKGGETLHCLLSNARSRARSVKGQGAEKVFERGVSEQCFNVLADLIEETRPNQDYRIDALLVTKCIPSIQLFCKDEVAHGSSQIMDCLMDNLDSKTMNTDCRNSLLDIQYFVARDWKLDAKLMKYCHNEAKTHCHAGDVAGRAPSASYSPMVLPCLYRHMLENITSAACTRELVRVMRTRAASVNLLPQIEDNCVRNLAEFCSSDDSTTNELECLQDHLEDLEAECKDAVVRFAEKADAFPSLDRRLQKACRRSMSAFCDDELEGADAGSVMVCFIRNKDRPEVPPSCRQAIEHHQIISLKDVRISVRFQRQCGPALMRFCSQAKTKAGAVSCLSDMLLKQIMMHEGYSIEHLADVNDKNTLQQLQALKVDPIPERCEKQIRFELFQRAQNLQLDPELVKACQNDIKDLCGRGNPEKMLECLRSNEQKLSAGCYRAVFQREKAQAAMPETDYVLMSVCGSMIHQFCQEVVNDPARKDQLFTCLKGNRQDPSFSSECKAIILARMLEESKSFFLQSSLMKNCAFDMSKYCVKEFRRFQNEPPEAKEIHALVVHCLRKHFTSVREPLQGQCRNEIRIIIRESAKNYQLDPYLVSKCDKHVKACLQQQRQRQPPADADADDMGGQDTNVEECLKQMFVAGQMNEDHPCSQAVSELVVEGRSDIFVNPHLHAVCASDVAKFCTGLTPGGGAIITCLLDVHRAEPTTLKPKCAKALEENTQMFGRASEFLKLEGLGDLVGHLQQSPNRHYFLLYFFIAVTCLLLMGVCCGRLSKRVPLETKLK